MDASHLRSFIVSSLIDQRRFLPASISCVHELDPTMYYSFFVFLFTCLNTSYGGGATRAARLHHLRPRLWSCCALLQRCEPSFGEVLFQLKSFVVINALLNRGAVVHVVSKVPRAFFEESIIKDTKGSWHLHEVKTDVGEWSCLSFFFLHLYLISRAEQEPSKLPVWTLIGAPHP